MRTMLDEQTDRSRHATGSAGRNETSAVESGPETAPGHLPKVASGAVVATLLWELPAGEWKSRELHQGESLALGSDSGADIELDLPDVSGKHCLVWADGEQVTIRDCYSSAGTFVNGQRISETVVHGDAALRIGECEVTLSRSGAHSTPVTPGNHPRKAPASAPGAADPVSPVAHVAAAEPDPFQEEMIELLRAEVLELQAALAERNHETAPDRASAPGDDETLPTRAEVERLTGRLEQLLEELAGRDRQVAMLEDLLHAAEEATQAEQEERHQLENWIDEIEERVSQREQEWEAELDRQRGAIENLIEERDQVAAALAANESNEQVQALQRLTDHLRTEIDQLKADVQKSEQQRQESQRYLEEQRIAAREEAVQISRERAELARLRHELESKRGETQPPLSPSPGGEHIRAVEQNLRDLHRQQKQEQNSGSLATRLGRLWRRLEGR